MLAILLAAALQFTEADARLAYAAAADFVTNCTPRDAGSIRGKIAANHVLDAASALGADVRRDSFAVDTPCGVRTFTNLYADFPTDASNRWVVLVSHFDTKPGICCAGANDGASTTGLLIAFANRLVNWPERHGNIMLVWTDGEECMGAHYAPNNGLQGSRRAVEHLKEAGRAVQAVICLDMLGDRDLNISIPVNSTPALTRIAQHAARRMGESRLVRTISAEVIDDHVPFLDAGYPAIDLIDFEFGSRAGANDYWHTPQDTMDKISVNSLLRSGKLVAEMVNILL